MKGKVIKEKSDERWPEKRILKEITKKGSKKKNISHTKRFKKTQEMRKRRKEKTERKEEYISLFWGKTYIFLDTSKQESKKGQLFFLKKKREWKKKTKKESHKTNEKLIFKTQKKTKHGQTNVKKEPNKEGNRQNYF